MQRAGDYDFRAVTALPLRLRTERVGALNLFVDEPGPMASADIAVGQALADVATIGILHQRQLSQTERRWEADADAMRAALLAHDNVLRTAIEEHEGFLFSHTGDGVVAAFASQMSAVTAGNEYGRDPSRM